MPQNRHRRVEVTVKPKDTKTQKWYKQKPGQSACKQYVFSIEADIYDDLKR